MDPLGLSRYWPMHLVHQIQIKYPFGWMGLMMNGTILPRLPPSLRVLPHCQNQSCDLSFLYLLEIVHNMIMSIASHNKNTSFFVIEQI